ncbi:uncharacterized protein LOC116300335 isoform X2 [Actinia tenebrosa]|uniref:Uncharacterized protein LOC116300335 isoform X1 n=1 Tax=Actinia tenebrosa TaxID=6105 RepID=A0A6P8IEA6_ACTTE|nr:uncharacterized protein LOC116300335 isoform X1 [Actinia tenebrosa]XP_031565047.1 uncharacterized protein LOC116300335 isoform X2 [Actinia tenebrosa]
MRRAFTTLPRSRMSIMELPYKIHQDLSKFLDPVGTMDWKHLVSQIPIYTAKDVKQMEIEASKPGMSCTKHLLEDMDNRGYSVDNLKNFLKMLGNQRALGCLVAALDDESLLHEDTATAQNRKGRIRPSTALEEPSDLHMKRSRVDHYICKPTDEIDLCENPDPGTRETLRVEHPIPRPAEEIDLPKNPDPGTREALRVDHPVPRPAEEIDLPKNPDPGTRETLKMGHPIHQPTDEIDFCKNPDPGTRETSRMDHDIFQYRCEMSEIQDTIGYNQEVRNRYQSENMPSENDETHNLDANGHTAQAPMYCPSTSRGQRVPIEREENKKSITEWRSAPLSLFLWIISCGSQSKDL